MTVHTIYNIRTNEKRNNTHTDTNYDDDDDDEIFSFFLKKMNRRTLKRNVRRKMFLERSNIEIHRSFRRQAANEFV